MPSGCWLGCSHPKARLQPEDMLPRWSISPGYWLEASGPHHIGLSLASLSVLTTWQSASPRVSDPRERARRKLSASYDLVSEVTHHRFCHRVFIGSRSPSQPTLPGRGTECHFLEGEAADDLWSGGECSGMRVAAGVGRAVEGYQVLALGPVWGCRVN